MSAAEPQLQRSRADLLLEHVAPPAAEQERPSAHERLERLVGGSLADMLVGALAGGRRPRPAEAE